jgi:hypothetical protein
MKKIYSSFSTSHQLFLFLYFESKLIKAPGPLLTLLVFPDEFGVEFDYITINLQTLSIFNQQLGKIKDGVPNGFMFVNSQSAIVTLVPPAFTILNLISLKTSPLILSAFDFIFARRSVLVPGSLYLCAFSNMYVI